MVAARNPSPDRLAGVLLGLASGDALGAGYEFGQPPVEEPTMIGGGLGGWEPGEWTDDTQMAICIAQVTATGSTDASDIGEHFLDWYRSGPADVGIQTRAVLSAASSGDRLHDAAAAYFDRNPRSAGNGSLMRTAPIALACLGDDDALVETAVEVSALTHGDPIAGEACAIWCVAIDRAIRDGRLDGVRDALDLLPVGSRDRWASILDDAEQRDPSTFTPNGFVVTALQAAYSSIVQTPIPADTPCRHLQHALSIAVRIGNDTDTVAAIAGALLGARWGASAIPAAWRRILHGWPGYRSLDLVRLALDTQRGGVDGQAWPAVGTMVEDYRERYPKVRDVAIELPDDPGVLIGDVGGLQGAGGEADVIISLCRVGRDDVRADAEHLDVWLIDDSAPNANPNLDFVLRDTASAIAAARAAGRSVFLHCVAAESRTPTVAAAYVANLLEIGGGRALERVRPTLPGADPNDGFRAALDRLWPGA